MDDLFAPPGVAWTRVSPQLAVVRRAVLGAVLGVMLTVWLVVSLIELEVWVALLGIVVLLALGGWGWWLIGRIVARWGYAERDEDLYIVHGAVRRRLVVVPYGRMQYADVQAGPLDRMVGLASVQMHTASPSTHAHIPGLPADEAARLRDRLTELGETEAAGL